MTSLTDFLLERVAEDEEIARDSHYDGQRWSCEEEAIVLLDRDIEPILLLDRKCDAYHAANWSPARVLAECEAKRAIVELHQRHDWLPEGRDECSVCGCADDAPVDWPCETLLILAQPYADHPDFDPAWRLP